MTDTSIPPCVTLVKLLPYWNSEWVRLSKSIYGFKRNCLGLYKLLPPTKALLGFAARSYEDLSPWHWNAGLQGCCGAGTPCSQDIPPEFLSTTCGCRTSLFCVSDPLTRLDGCDFFNFIVVRLPFNSISDVSEPWLFYILAVILMWLCDEVSHVYLCHPLPYQCFDNNFSHTLCIMSGLK